MFNYRFEKNGSITETNNILGHWSTSGFGDTQSVYHNIYYDNIKKFCACLNIQMSNKKFNSLNFMYSPKGKNGQKLILNVANMDNKSLIIHCTDNGDIHKQYTIDGCDELLSQLWDVVCLMNKARVETDAIKDNSFLLKRSKALLEQYALITESLLVKETVNTNLVSLLINQFQIEVDCFDNHIDLNDCPKF